MTTLTKKDVARRVAELMDEPIYKSEPWVTAVVTSISDLLLQADPEVRIELRDFGVFEVKKTRAKPKARNPKTNETVFIPSRRKTHFKPSKKLEECAPDAAVRTGLRSARRRRRLRARQSSGHRVSGLRLAPRIVGVDYGSKRTGLAVADPLGLFARPLGTFAPGHATVELVKLDAREGVAVIALGWPFEPDGAEGEAVERVRSFEGRLRKALPQTEIVRVDERYSSTHAVSQLRQAGASRRVRREKGLVDAAAACVILEDYLRDR